MVTAEYLQRCRRTIDANGWMVQTVIADEATATFSYTVGLTEAGLPELWLGSLGPDQATLILNAVAHAAVAALPDRLPLGVDVDVEFTVPFRLAGPVSVEAAEPYVALELYPHPQVVEVLQVLWPDPSGVFPGEAAYDAGVFPQRLLPDRGVDL